MSFPPWLDLSAAVAAAVFSLIEYRRWRGGVGRWQWVGIYAAFALAFFLFWLFSR